MMPPRLSDVAEAEWMWRPEGWPEGRALPAEGKENLEEVLTAWLRMSFEDAALAVACRSSILNSISDGYVLGTHWFAEDGRDGFLELMAGNSEERRGIACVLDSLNTGIHIRTDGLVLVLEEDVIRLEDSACHPNLVALWPDHGLTILDEIYGISGSEAEAIHAKQMHSQAPREAAMGDRGLAFASRLR
jgi:hypothetical protein